MVQDLVPAKTITAMVRPSCTHEHRTPDQDPFAAPAGTAKALDTLLERRNGRRPVETLRMPERFGPS